MAPEDRVRLTLLLIGALLLTLTAIVALWTLAWARRRRTRHQRRKAAHKRQRPRRLMPDLWQAGGDRLAQRLTQERFGRHTDEPGDRERPDGETGNLDDALFDRDEDEEADEDGESWKNGQPYEPTFDAPFPPETLRDDDDADDGDDEVEPGDGHTGKPRSHDKGGGRRDDGDGDDNGDNNDDNNGDDDGEDDGDGDGDVPVPPRPRW